MGTPLSLVGTAELPLAGYYVNTILPVEVILEFYVSHLHASMTYVYRAGAAYQDGCV